MLADLIHPGAFGFRMKFERGDFSSFYGATPNGVDILAERRKWLAQEPARYLGVLPDAAPLFRETMQLARDRSREHSGIHRYVRARAPPLTRSRDAPSGADSSPA